MPTGAETVEDVVAVGKRIWGLTYVPSRAGFRVELDHAWSKGISGRCTLLTFDEAPEGAVTIDGQGLTDDLTSQGKLCTNPVDVMETLREHVFGLADENVSAARMAASRTWADKYHLRVAGVVDSKTLALDVMAHLLANSFLAGGVDQDLDHLEIPGGGDAPIQEHRRDPDRLESPQHLLAVSGEGRIRKSRLCRHFGQNGPLGRVVRSDQQPDVCGVGHVLRISLSSRFA